MIPDICDTTLALMCRIENRICRLEDLAQTHCGHEEPLEKYLAYHRKTLNFIAIEIDKLMRNQKAEVSVPSSANGDSLETGYVQSAASAVLREEMKAKADGEPI